MKKKAKLLLFIVASLLVLLVFATLLLPARGQVVSAATVYAPDSLVWQQLHQLRAYTGWFPWADPERAAVLYAKDGAGQIKAFAFRRQGADGHGQYRLGKEQGDSILHYTLTFSNMPRMEGRYLVQKQGDHSLVIWEMDMEAGWRPWWRFYAAMMHKLSQPLLDSGLARFKQQCEQSQKGQSLAQ